MDYLKQEVLQTYFSYRSMIEHDGREKIFDALGFMIPDFHKEKYQTQEMQKVSERELSFLLLTDSYKSANDTQSLTVLQSFIKEENSQNIDLYESLLGLALKS